MTPKEQVQFKILRAVEQNPQITERQLSKMLGVSTGKAHYLMVALIDKGLLKIGSFSRNDGKAGKLAYLLTHEGIKSRADLTMAYLSRKEAEYEALWAEIKALRHEGMAVSEGSALAAEQGAK